MSDYIEVQKAWLREVIRGKITFRKCPDCDKDGMEYWDENGCNVGPSPREEWGDNYDFGQCQTCDGIGYVENARDE